MNKRSIALVVFVTVLTGTYVHAHNAWFDPKQDNGAYVILYGHPGDLSGYAPDKVKMIRAIDAAGKSINAKQRVDDRRVLATFEGKPSLLALDFDNGYFSRTPEGARNTPKNETPNATSTLHAYKYSKTVLDWNRSVGQTIGQRLEMTSAQTTAPKAGAMLPILVRWEGKPLAGAKLVKLEDYAKKDAAPRYTTDANGMVGVPVIKGWQQVELEHEFDLVADARADRHRSSFVLTFEGK